jgi:hypothetical protein
MIERSDYQLNTLTKSEFVSDVVYECSKTDSLIELIMLPSHVTLVLSNVHTHSFSLYKFVIDTFWCPLTFIVCSCNMASTLRPRYLTESEVVTLANAEEDPAHSDDIMVDSGSSTDDEEGKVNISDRDGDTAAGMQQDMINYNPQREMP